LTAPRFLSISSTSFYRVFSSLPDVSKNSPPMKEYTHFLSPMDEVFNRGPQRYFFFFPYVPDVWFIGKPLPSAVLFPLRSRIKRGYRPSRTQLFVAPLTLHCVTLMCLIHDAVCRHFHPALPRLSETVDTSFSLLLLCPFHVERMVRRGLRFHPWLSLQFLAFSA